MPVPPVRITAWTFGSAHAPRTTRWTSAGSSRTMLDPTTVWPPALRSSRMTAPLVSVSGVFVSEIVSTKQPMERGAVALWISGVAVGAIDWPAGEPAGGRPTVGVSSRSGISVSPVQQFDDVENRDIRAVGAKAGLDLENAPGVGGHHGFRPGGHDVLHLAMQQAGRHLGLRQIVDTGRAAAPVRFLEIHDLQARDLGEERSRLSPDLLTVHDVTRIVIGDGHRHGVQRAAEGLAGEELGDVLHRRREPARALGPGGIAGEQRAVGLHVRA